MIETRWPHHKVDFFICGVQKGGTTALDNFLRRHHGVQMAGKKETHYFDNETENWDSPNYEKLHKHYDWSQTGVKRGEATPISIFWPPSLERIHSYNPNARLVVLLRHPTFRAYSHWRMMVAFGSESLAFTDAISNKGRRRIVSPTSSENRQYSYIERGLYSGQISRLLKLFGRQQILFLKTDDLWLDPNHILRLCESHLSLESQMNEQVKREYIIPETPVIEDKIPEDAKSFLNELFRDDMVETQKLTGLDFQEWFSADFEERQSTVGVHVHIGKSARPA